MSDSKFILKKCHNTHTVFVNISEQDVILLKLNISLESVVNLPTIYQYETDNTYRAKVVRLLVLIGDLTSPTFFSFSLKSK